MLGGYPHFLPGVVVMKAMNMSTFVGTGRGVVDWQEIQRHEQHTQQFLIALWAIHA